MVIKIEVIRILLCDERSSGVRQIFIRLSILNLTKSNTIDSANVESVVRNIYMNYHFSARMNLLLGVYVYIIRMEYRNRVGDRMMSYGLKPERVGPTLHPIHQYKPECSGFKD